MVSFNHVRQNANKVVDLLANVSAEGSRARMVGTFDKFKNERWVAQCRHLAVLDVEFYRQMDDCGQEARDGDRRQEETRVGLSAY